MREIRTLSNNAKLVAERREQIALCAMELFVKKGYDNTSMFELARVLGWSKPTLYTYVGSKEDIIFLIQEYTRDTHAKRFEELDAHLAKLDPIETLCESIRIYIEGIDKMQNAYNFLNHVVVILSKDERKRMFALFDVMRQRFEKLLLRGIEAGKFRMDNPKLMAQNIVLIGTAWAHWRWSFRRMANLEEYIKLQTECILKGILAN